MNNPELKLTLSERSGKRQIFLRAENNFGFKKMGETFYTNMFIE
jgi:hypothetical protein